jgi:hypothetical protein
VANYYHGAGILRESSEARNYLGILRSIDTIRATVVCALSGLARASRLQGAGYLVILFHR